MRRLHEEKVRIGHILYLIWNELCKTFFEGDRFWGCGKASRTEQQGSRLYKNIVREGLMVKEKGYLLPWVKTWTVKTCQWWEQGTKIANESTRETFIRECISRDRAWPFTMTKRKRAAKELDRDNALLPQVNKKIDDISISLCFSRKNITASEPMRIHFLITLFFIPLHLILSTGQLTIQHSQVPVKFPNMQISVAALVVFWSILLQYSRTSLCLVRWNLTHLPTCSIDHSWPMVIHRHGNSCSSLAIRPWSNRSAPRYIFSWGRTP